MPNYRTVNDVKGSYLKNAISVESGSIALHNVPDYPEPVYTSGELSMIKLETLDGATVEYLEAYDYSDDPEFSPGEVTYWVSRAMENTSSQSWTTDNCIVSFPFTSRMYEELQIRLTAYDGGNVSRE